MHLIHGRIAHGIDPVIRAHGGAIDRPEQFPFHGPVQAAEEFDIQGGLPHFQVQPLAVEAILVGIAGIYVEYKDIHQIRMVDREGPAQIPVVAQNDHRAAGEETARGVHRFAVDMGLVPRHRPGPRLVGVDGEKS